MADVFLQKIFTPVNITEDTTEVLRELGAQVPACIDMVKNIIDLNTATPLTTNPRGEHTAQ
jgi:hypothetical protein